MDMPALDVIVDGQKQLCQRNYEQCPSRVKPALEDSSHESSSLRKECVLRPWSLHGNYFPVVKVKDGGSLDKPVSVLLERSEGGSRFEDLFDSVAGSLARHFHKGGLFVLSRTVMKP